MKKNDLIKQLEAIPGNPVITLPHPAVVGAVTTVFVIHQEKAGKNQAVPKALRGNFPTLHIHRYYPAVVKDIEDVIVFSIWPKI